MIKEILEQNGFEVKGMYNYWEGEQSYDYYLYKDGELIKHISCAEKSNHLFEDLPKQYVKENGFKLEWFKGNLYEHMETLYDNLSEALFLALMSDSELPINQKQCKLIAWLYANDIEIKE